MLTLTITGEKTNGFPWSSDFLLILQQNCLKFAKSSTNALQSLVVNSALIQAKVHVIKVYGPTYTVATCLCSSVPFIVNGTQMYLQIPVLQCSTTQITVPCVLYCTVKNMQPTPNFLCVAMHFGSFILNGLFNNAHFNALLLCK